MRQHLFSKVNVKPGQIRFPDGLATDIPAHCAAYEAAIRDAGGIDLQLLGIGSDGHIGFNEPSSSLASRTRIKTLTQRTVQDNARFFGSPAEVPRHVITMGVGTIMDAKACLLLATGASKAEAVAGMAEGPITADLPASILQMHPNCKLVVDEAAAAKLRRADYYRWVYANKPAWQQI
jgi:glucosamine-6-phosphate deaminase